PGEIFRGVKLISMQGDRAILKFGGRKHELRIGEAPANVGGTGADGTGTRIVLNSTGGGHFMALGQINGKTAQMVVDTGATVVALDTTLAERMGIAYKSGQSVQMSTANGIIPGWRIKLGTVKVGEVTVREVDAVVTSGSMPFVLLGNSFLTRFQMTRNNDQLVLEKRY
ncbi:MAG: TIGR02281 family clan AA aspartic protease, partial [Burkholderiales bacterium PBB4]